MHRRLTQALVLGVIALSGGASLSNAAAQELTPGERAQVEEWFRQTVDRTGDGEWGIAVGTMSGQVLWSVNPELELIPASTAKIFTLGFSRARAGGGARISTRVIGRGKLDSTTGRWIGAWQLELGGDPTLERAGRAGPTLRELARQLHAKGIREIDGPLALTSRTGPAESRYPAVRSADFAGQ